MKSIYVAGPMRGYLHFNFPAFDEAALTLRADGWRVFSPAEHDREGGFDETANSLDGFDLAAAMRWDLDCVLKANAVALLPGWRASSGTAIELTVANAVGCDVYEYVDGKLRGVEAEPVSAEALRIVRGARAQDYGPPIEDFTRTGRMWGAILGTDDVAPLKVGLMMVALKISREVNAHKRDNLVDLCGYAETVDMCQT